MSKAMKCVFTFSLILNVLMIGTFCGYAMYHHRGDNRPDWKAMSESLSPETRELMKTTFKEKRKNIVEIFKEVRSKKAALEDVYTAEVFDPVAYDSAADELQQIGAKIAKSKLETFKGLAEQLPQSERKIIVKNLTASVLGRHGWSSKKFKEHRDGEVTEKGKDRPE